MTLEAKYNDIIDRLNNGMKFGLFENGKRCYFQDGMHISYNDLWKAIRLWNENRNIEKRSLAQICPNSYVGNHPYKHTRHIWDNNGSLQTKSRRLLLHYNIL